MYEHILLLIALLGLSGLFSGLETAFVSVSLIKARSFKDQNLKNGVLLYAIKQNPRRLLITVLIGNNLVNIGASSYATFVITNMFGSAGVGIATGVMTLLILTFGEILPKTFFAKHANSIALKFSPFMYLLQIIFFPIVLFFELLSNLFKIDSEVQNAISENDIQAMIDVGEESDVLHKRQKQMIYSIFEFDDTKVREIMTPRVDMFALEENTIVKDALKEIQDKGFSRIPVFKESIEKTIGYIHIRDLLADKNKTKKVGSLANELLFVSGEKIIQELFASFQKNRNHIAIVVDEHGGVDGLVTLEDVLEELVGDILDESDDVEVPIKQLNKTTYKIRGDAEIYTLNEKLHTRIPEDKDFSTLSGFIQFKIKDLPVKDQEIVDKRRKLKFKILKMQDHTIEEVQLTKL